MQRMTRALAYEEVVMLYVGWAVVYTRAVTEDPNLRKLNAIVGAAIKALAESGADDEFVGAFANSHRIKVAVLLGRQEIETDPPDLVSIVSQAVSKAMEAAGVASIAGKAPKAPVKRMNVLIDGRRTCVTVRCSTEAQLIAAKGDRKQAREFIQELANKAPDDVQNRSGWVEERLQAFLRFSKDEAGVTRRH